MNNTLGLFLALRFSDSSSILYPSSFILHLFGLLPAQADCAGAVRPLDAALW